MRASLEGSNQDWSEVLKDLKQDGSEGQWRQAIEVIPAYARLIPSTTGFSKSDAQEWDRPPKNEEEETPDDPSQVG